MNISNPFFNRSIKYKKDTVKCRMLLIDSGRDLASDVLESALKRREKKEPLKLKFSEKATKKITRWQS